MYKQIAINRRKTIILMLTFVIFIIGLGYILTLYFDSPLILILAVVISVIMSWWSYFKGDRAVLMLSGARPIDPESNLVHRKALHLVENLCITAGLPQPKVFIINDSAPNAFATGRNPQHASIALTSGLIEKLDKVELEGVIAHELSHIKNYDILLATVVITLLGVIILLSDWTLRAHFIRQRGRSTRGFIMLIGLLLAILSPILARLIYLAISRKREYLADASGALLTRYPEGLASALKKINIDRQQLRLASRATASLYFVNPFTKVGMVVYKLFLTHPPIEKRIKALNNMSI